ncbi:MAG: hypothetical protein F4017_00785 [Acidimicrobiaceae bacterium]|nr:hypothetical protein [Acidimicrobiaceae bacterium]MYK73121.1 hypothetical protein [Acidimicrobiaceae bacterium]
MRLWTLAGTALALFAASCAALAAAPAWAQPSDTDQAGVHRDAVEALGAAGVLSGTGCTPDRLCPQQHLPRWAMAVWLVRALDGRDPPSTRDSRFVDVASRRWWAPHVERLFDLRVTYGCGAHPARFCPYQPVSRGETASFLRRAFRLSPADPAEIAGFVDTGGNIHESAIDALAVAGVTTGCSTSPARFCPDAPVTRAEMASLLTRALRFNAAITWLSAGDSYSSGVGTDPHARGPAGGARARPARPHRMRSGSGDGP